MFLQKAKHWLLGDNFMFFRYTSLEAAALVAPLPRMDLSACSPSLLLCTPLPLSITHSLHAKYIN